MSILFSLSSWKMETEVNVCVGPRFATKENRLDCSKYTLCLLIYSNILKGKVVTRKWACNLSKLYAKTCVQQERFSQT